MLLNIVANRCILSTDYTQTKLEILYYYRMEKGGGVAEGLLGDETSSDATTILNL